MKKIVVYLMIVGLGLFSRGAAAQDLFESQTLGELPPQMALPAPTEAMSSIGNSVMLPEESVSTTPIQEPLSLPATTGDDPSPSWGYFTGQDLQMFDCQPALLESTGTWLRRGFWSAEVDAVILHRSFGRDSVILLADYTNNAGTTFNSLSISRNGGVEGLPRLNLGRFLFRDQENRDHFAEFVAFGGGNWSQSGQLDGADLRTDFFVPLLNTFGQVVGVERVVGVDNDNPSFNGAQSSQYDYDSWFNNFELNYHVKQRMLKDRMELEPSGHWVRRANPSRSNSFLAGLRLFNLNEQLNWNAFGIPDSNADGMTENGNYYVKTNNMLIGTQVGGSSTFETARWSLGAHAKGGMYLNMISLDSSFDVPGINEGSSDLERDKISFIGEAGVLGKYHISPNTSLRVGLEIMLVNHIAVAPSQINFIPGGGNSIATGSDNYFMGGSIGFEGYW